MMTTTRYKSPKLEAAKTEARRIFGRVRIFTDPVMKGETRVGSLIRIAMGSCSCMDDRWTEYCKQNGIIPVTHYGKHCQYRIMDNSDDVSRLVKKVTSITECGRYVHGITYRAEKNASGWEWIRVSLKDVGHVVPNIGISMRDGWELVPMIDPNANDPSVMTAEEIIALDMLQDEQFDLIETIPGLSVIR